ncbi:MAG: catalase [Ruminococcus sp.]|nr:catalase [Ruminococcus sp.]
MAHPIKHFITITKHRHTVIVHCKKAGILWQGLRHDLSKYSPTEFIPGAKYYQGTRSPNELERELLGYSRAWMHHKGRNRHHYEFWNDYNPKTKRPEHVEMPLKYVIEMFCDRVAASKTYNGKDYTDADPFTYFLRIRGKHRLHENTEALLEKLLVMLRDEGEEKTFGYIRAMLKEDKHGRNR